MDGVPKPEDHFIVNIIVKQIGFRNSATFNHLLERLTRQRIIQVGENPRRLFHARFITSTNSELLKFSDLHLHHRIFGFVGVACEQPSTSADTALEEDVAALSISSRRRSSTLGPSTVTIADVRHNYDKVKEEYFSHILDSRIICIGYDEESISRHFSQREVFSFPTLEESDQLETDIRDFLRAIYFVLESKRVDVSFEKLELQESPSCPILPEEERYRIGLENKTSKNYKRKSIGRSRKQNGDYALLTGLPQLALDAYSSAIELLKSSNDLLWLAASYEGWACAATILRFELGITEDTALPRIASMTPRDMRDGQTLRNNLVAQGHQRHRSDENALPSFEDKKKSRIAFLRSDRPRDRIDTTTITERFESALENYGKFSFIALIEYSCMMKAICVFKLQRKYIDMEAFHRDHVGKYLDDSFTRFDHLLKAAICNNSATLYREIHFYRKSSFFARLGVLFRLHIGEGEQRNEADYKIVYPVLYKTLSGYGIIENMRENSTVLQGPVFLQIKALHEVYTAASRAGLIDAAIRHICHLIQVYYDDIDSSLLSRLFDDLGNLIKKKGSIPVLNQRINVGVGNIILPPIQLTRFPSISLPEIIPLPPHLAPTVIKAEDNEPAIFIYSPFQKKKESDVSWVVNCPGNVSVQVFNCRNVELLVRDLCLLTEGCSFESIPMRLILPPADSESIPTRINLIGIPRSPGVLKITGYSCEVLDLRNVCKLKAANGEALAVNVLPSLAVVKLESSLPRAPLENDQQETSAETTVYSGQIFEHSLTIENDSVVSVRKARLQVWQPTVSGGPSLIELADGSDENFKLASGEKKKITFKIFGIDPTATADDEGGEDKEKLVETVLPLASTVAEDIEEAHDLIPYTGRLLTCQFVVHYEADVDGEQGERYERDGKLSLAICIVPALTVSAWHVLPGDGPFSRYIVVDVTNSTDHDAELVYSANRRMNVLPKETCRVPLLSPCCSDVAGRAFYVATQKDSHMMQRLEVEKLRRTLERHVSKHLDIRWSIPTMNLDGLVPVGALLSSVSLLKQLVLPAISLDIRVNSMPYISEDDLAVPIKDVVTVKFRIISSLDYDFEGVMAIECYQEISQQFGTIDRGDDLCFISQKKVPFMLPKNPTNINELSGPSCEVQFQFFFRAEGIHKIRPIIVSRNISDALFSDEIFVSSISFSVFTKAH